ncbi:TadE/TadG family type IV pilus assembly protein [Brevundimonas sp. NPDC092305]|uniref:TadE/TadG family type IV pilus assembly protein n=1 Tax=Brevundimonas sp. NPDC092305 TaxID=3363957 RepID=UPI0037F59DB3
MRRRHLLKRLSRRGFWHATEGATAVEFGLVIFPFMFMLFAIIEVAMYFTVGSVADNAMIETGRLIRTGQAEAQRMTQDQFRDNFCSRMSIFAPDCAARTTVDVRVIDLSDPPEDPLASGRNPRDEDQYSYGAAGDLILVRIWYEQPMFTGFLTPGLSRLPNGPFLLSSATAFRNEPK